MKLYVVGFGLFGFVSYVIITNIFFGKGLSPIMVGVYFAFIIGILAGLLTGERSVHRRLSEKYRQPLMIAVSLKIPDTYGKNSGIWYIHVLLDPITQKISPPADPADRVATRTAARNFEQIENQNLLRVPFWFKDGKLIIYKELYSFSE